MLDIFQRCVDGDEESWETLKVKVNPILTEYIKSSYPYDDIEEIRERIWQGVEYYTPKIGIIYLEVTIERWMKELL